MRDAIIEKLKALLDRGITTEAECVYFFVEARKLLDRGNNGGKEADAKVARFISQNGDDEPYTVEHVTPYTPGPDWLRFYCDWAVHSKLEGGQARAALRVVEEALPVLGARDSGDYENALPREFENLMSLRALKSEIERFCEKYKLPLLNDVHRFKRLFCQIVEDCPLKLPADKAGATAVLCISCQVERWWGRSGRRFFTNSWRFELADGRTEVFLVDSGIEDDELLSGEGELWPPRGGKG